MWRAALVLASVVLGTAAHSPSVRAQDAHPSRPITLIVPFSAGGISDVIARLAAEQMSQALGPPREHGWPGAIPASGDEPTPQHVRGLIPREIERFCVLLAGAK
jgi:hypothetical protein